MYFLYILKCSDDSLYTGIAKDLEKREKQHNGELTGGAKYTRGRRPVEIVYTEKSADKSTALKREIEIKKLTKKEKLLLIQKPMREFKNRKDYEKNTKYKTKEDCPFCEENIKKGHTILCETQHWIILEALYPYFDEQGHLLVVPKKHREFTTELSKEEFADFKAVEKFMQKHFGGTDYFSFIRQSRSNKSIEHLHYHYLPGKPGSKIIDGEKYFKIKE